MTEEAQTPEGLLPDHDRIDRVNNRVFNGREWVTFAEYFNPPQYPEEQRKQMGEHLSLMQGLRLSRAGGNR